MKTLTMILLLCSCVVSAQVPRPNWNERPSEIMVQAVCLPSMEMVSRLMSLGERPWITADIQDEQGGSGMIVFWTDPNNSNWTVTASFQATSCILSAGKGWREAFPKPSL